MPKAERSSELGWQKKNEQKKKVRRRPPILYLVKLFTFWSKFLPFSPSFNLQKLFLMFSTSTIYPKDIQRKQFSNKSFLKKKKSKKIIHSFFLCPKPTQHLFLSILLQFIFFQQKKRSKKHFTRPAHFNLGRNQKEKKN